jgi:hypothetical protein
MLQLHHTSITLSNIISYNTSNFLQHFYTANALFIYTILQFCTFKILAEHSDLKCVSCATRFSPGKEREARAVASPTPTKYKTQQLHTWEKSELHHRFNQTTPPGGRRRRPAAAAHSARQQAGKGNARASQPHLTGTHQ